MSGLQWVIVGILLAQAVFQGYLARIYKLAGDVGHTRASFVVAGISIICAAAVLAIGNT